MDANDLDLSENPAATPVGKDEAYFAPNKPAKHAHAVLYNADYQHPHDGTAIAARSHALALSEQGVPVLLKGISSRVIKGGVVEDLMAVGLDESVKDEIGHLVTTSAAALCPSIKHVVPHDAESLGRVIMRGSIGPADNLEFVKKAREAIYGQTILYTVWERDRIDEKMVAILKRVHENWVPCEHNASVLRAHGIENVAVVPHPFDLSDPICRLSEREPRKYGSVDLTQKRFYTIGRWEPRKGMHELIGAFLSKYLTDDSAHLTIKTHEVGWPDYPNVETSLKWWADKFKTTIPNVEKRVKILTRPLNRNGILRLHFENNIYVCASHGEAFCLPGFEAKIAGNRMVHVPWGGTADFDSSTDVRVSWWMGSVPRSYKWPEGSCWANFSADDLADALEAVDPPTSYARSERLDGFTRDAVGKLMAERIARLLDDKQLGNVKESLGL